jgi:ribosomal protein L11 methyltransferase
LDSYPALDLRWRSGADLLSLHERIHSTIDEFDPLAIHEDELADGWRIFFRSARQQQNAATALQSSLGDALVSLEPIGVLDDDWARRSQQSLRAVSVGRIVVAPPWDEHPQHPQHLQHLRYPSTITIVIDPSTGFGSGHHETTRLCLELLQATDVAGRRAIDVGTGSGVLAIAAWKLGASRVVALDNDPDALRSARENVVRNGAEIAIDVLDGDLASLSVEPADVVTANLTGAVIRRYAIALRELTRPGGRLIVSGFNPEECEDVMRSLASLGVTAVRTLRVGDWAGAALRRAERAHGSVRTP